MRSGITAKLFFALFATCMLVVITMQWGVRVSFEHGFIHYIKRRTYQPARQRPGGAVRPARQLGISAQQSAAGVSIAALV